MSLKDNEKGANNVFQKKNESEISSIDKSKDKFEVPPMYLPSASVISPTPKDRGGFRDARTLDLNTIETPIRKNTDFSVPINNQTLSLNNDGPKEADDFNQIFKDQFIGEFHTDRNFKIIRAYTNQNNLDRIFYTRFEPTTKFTKTNILIVHGYGHSGHFLEVS